MSAASERIVEEILSLEKKISEASQKGEDTSDLQKKRVGLQKQLTEKVEQLEKGKVLKG